MFLIKLKLILLITLYLLMTSTSIYAAEVGPGGCCGNQNVTCANSSCNVVSGSSCPYELECVAFGGGNVDFRLPDYTRVGGGFLFDQDSGSLREFSPGSIGAIVSDVLPYTFIIAGLLLFAYLLYGGFHLATSFGSPKAILEAWHIIFRALVGFVLVFASFWLMRIVEIVFGIKII